VSRLPSRPRELQLIREGTGVTGLRFGLSLKPLHDNSDFMLRLMLEPSVGLSLMDVRLVRQALFEQGNLGTDRALVRVDCSLRESLDRTDGLRR